ncbi:MAG: ORF6N domain-containing protein [Desulfobacteraceae bacterium]|nr:ORF6N domain-containing protein [Desulfobacteraceae bacterium]
MQQDKFIQDNRIDKVFIMDEKMIKISIELIEQAIFLIRGQKVLLDADLAQLYGVETKILNKAVKRNLDRFPEDFMFQLTAEEAENLRFQIGTSKKQRGGRRYLPYAFTEQGVAMLSGVLNSPRAVKVNVEIMRAFVRLRQLMATHTDLARKLTALEQKYDKQFKVVFDAIRALMTPPAKPRKKIGFVVKEKQAAYGKKTKGSRRKK